MLVLRLLCCCDSDGSSDVSDDTCVIVCGGEVGDGCDSTGNDGVNVMIVVMVSECDGCIGRLEW